METHDPDSFDDAALKDAIRRAWKDQAAPPELIQRIRNSSAVSRSGFSRPLLRFALAAAALILISLAVVGYLMRGSAPSGIPVASALPASLAKDLIDRHDERRSHPDHHMPGVPTGSYTAIASASSARLGWPVLAKSLGPDWSFKGASICPVGSQGSAHLVFKRGNADVSVFSLPAKVVANCTDNATYDQMQSGHPIAAFISNGGLFCIVCSSPDGSLTLATAKTLRTQLQTEPQTAQAAPRTTIAGR